MNYKKHILLFLLLIFCFTDCKKYPEGPNFTLRSAKCRITGVWELEYYEANGLDSTSYILSDPCYSRYYFKNDPKGCNRLDERQLKFIPVNGLSCDGEGGWNFGRTKDYLSLDMCSMLSSLGAYGRGASWKIRRLTNKEMWLKMNDEKGANKDYTHQNYYMKLKKISEKP